MGQATQAPPGRCSPVLGSVAFIDGRKLKGVKIWWHALKQGTSLDRGRHELVLQYLFIKSMMVGRAAAQQLPESRRHDGGGCLIS